MFSPFIEITIIRKGLDDHGHQVLDCFGRSQQDIDPLKVGQPVSPNPETGV
jgi:hypothetical protein